VNLTEDQIASFNAYQAAGFMHPFTCGTKDKHQPGADDVLVASAPSLYEAIAAGLPALGAFGMLKMMGEIMKESPRALAVAFADFEIYEIGE
jgi:hypothetical protein